jgi:hypothetical protein
MENFYGCDKFFRLGLFFSRGLFTDAPAIV